MGVYRPVYHDDELSHGINWKKHKYIAKIGDGIKAKYFYSMEELDTYKKALSSKDEYENYQTAQKKENKANDDMIAASGRVSQAEERRNNALKDYSNAKKDYSEYTGTSGFFKKVKGLTSKTDENSEQDARRQYDSASRNLGRKQHDFEKADKEYKESQKAHTNAEALVDQKIKDYRRAQSLKGKGEDLSSALKSYNHKKMADTVDKGVDKIKKTESNLEAFSEMLDEAASIDSHPLTRKQYDKWLEANGKTDYIDYSTFDDGHKPTVKEIIKIAKDLKQRMDFVADKSDGDDMDYNISRTTDEIIDKATKKHSKNKSR